MIYADPSFLCSLYGWDENSAKAVQAINRERPRPLFLSPWQAFEVRNKLRLATGRLTRAGQLLRFQTGSALKTIQEDIASRRLRHVEPDWHQTMRLAEELSEGHTEQENTGAVDVWHVAAAILLNAHIFWTFDACQRALAGACRRIPKVPNLRGA